jgi:hypothetical protein
MDYLKTSLREINYLDYSQKYSHSETNTLTYTPHNDTDYIGRLTFNTPPVNLINTVTLIDSSIGKFIVTNIVNAITFDVKLFEPRTTTENTYTGVIYFKYNKFTLADSLYKGQSFNICGDGCCYKLAMDANGSFELPLGVYVGDFVIGKAYVSVVKTNNLGGMMDTVNLQIMKKNIIKAFFRLYSSFGGKFGTDFNHLVDIIYKANQYQRELMGIPYTIEDSDIQINYSDRWENNKYYYIIQDKPLPFNVNSITLTEDQQ